MLSGQRINTPIRTSDYRDMYLKGSDIPESQNTVVFKVLGFVNKPGARTQITAEISETFGKTLFGVNVTNIRVAENLGFDDLQKAVGKTWHCAIVMQRNPQSDIPARSLLLYRIE